MKYTEDDILNRRLILESEFFISQYTKDIASATLPKSKGFDSYLSSSADLPEWLRDEPFGTRELHEREVHVGIFAIPQSDEKLYFVLNEHDSSSLENQLSTLLVILLSIGIFITIVGLVIGLIFSKLISKPIILLTNDVENDQRDLHQAFYGSDRHDEVGALSRAFNRLVGRLQSFLERERQFTRYASHELRTPISLIKNALAVLHLPEQNEARQARNLSRIDSAVIELESLVTTFLALGREDTKIEMQSVNMLSIIKRNIERNNAITKNKRFEIVLKEVETPLPFIANSALIDILIDNIIRNMYTHGATQAQISLSANEIKFENDVPSDAATDKHGGSSFGTEIISKIANSSGISITSALKGNVFETVLKRQVL